ncbi:MAG: CDGSH iron-sulfur domain-containing protein [Thermoplasmatales archaeon]|nr:MAG: CDGSH iron-sulfur domain-containing protein [Thermoplasmatales archaeon]
MVEEKESSIESTRNGPYLVKNLQNFKNSKNEDIMGNPVMTLCRCGGSNTKPFCDGTHMKNGFIDTKEDDRIPDKLDTYEGEKLTIHDNRGVCSHRGHCTGNAPKVFRMEAEPWIDPDAQATDDTTKVIKTCPSGALSYTKDGALSKDWNHEPAIIISKDGPYDVVGHIEYKDPDGNKPESKEHYTLCRCGHSKNKPFCSGQHWYVKFKDPKN